jgi:hypothetical protein
MRKLNFERVSGRFLVRPAEIARVVNSAGAAGWVSGRTQKLCSGGSPRHTKLGRGVTPPSDVTSWMQIITNPGRSVAAGVVLRCPVRYRVL